MALESGIWDISPENIVTIEGISLTGEEPMMGELKNDIHPIFQNLDTPEYVKQALRLPSRHLDAESALQFGTLCCSLNSRKSMS